MYFFNISEVTTHFLNSIVALRFGDIGAESGYALPLLFRQQAAIQFSCDGKEDLKFSKGEMKSLRHAGLQSPLKRMSKDWRSNHYGCPPLVEDDFFQILFTQDVAHHSPEGLSSVCTLGSLGKLKQNKKKPRPRHISSEPDVNVEPGY